MPTIALTQVAGSVSLSSTWVTVGDADRINIQHAVAPEIAGPGIEITKIEITGRTRNSSSASKKLRLGFKPALTSGRDTWAMQGGNAVLDASFTAIDGSKTGSYIYNTFTRTYSASANAAAFTKFAAHIRECFANNTDIYLGIIQPTAQYSISVHVAGYWTIAITYNVLGNIPSTNVGEATVGATEITTTIDRIIPDSTTTLKYKIGTTVLKTVNLGSSTSDAYTPPESVATNHFPNDLTGILTVEATTFLEGVVHGIVSTDVVLTLPESAAPGCVCTPSMPAQAIPGVSAYIQNQSGVVFSVSGTGKLGASIVGYALAFDGGEYDAFPAAIPNLPRSGTLPFSLVVTDSRGLTGVHTGSIYVFPWKKPAFLVGFACARATTSGVIDDDGESVLYAMSVAASPITVNGVQRNTLSYQIKSRAIGTSAWITNDPVYAPGGAYALSPEQLIYRDGLIAPYTAYQGYEFMVEVHDLFDTAIAEYTIPTNARQFVLGADGKSVSFGGPITGTANAPNAAFHHPAVFLGGLPQLNWSTNEVDTGATWLDGKRLYARTIVLTGTAQPSIASIVDVADTVLLGRCCSVTTYSSKRYVSNSFYASTSDSARVFLNLSDKVARATFGSGHSNQVSYIEILYTKK